MPVSFKYPQTQKTGRQLWRPQWERWDNLSEQLLTLLWCRSGATRNSGQKGKRCAFCVLVLCFKCVYINVCVERKNISLQCWYRGMCAISTIVLFTRSNATYQISVFLRSAFSHCAVFSFSQSGAFYKCVVKRGAPLPALLWNCNNKQEVPVLQVALHRECFSSWETGKRWGARCSFNSAIPSALCKTLEIWSGA